MLTVDPNLRAFRMAAAISFAADIETINANQKIKRAFIYTLVDYIGEVEQQRFGLFNDDWTPKPAAK